MLAGGLFESTKSEIGTTIKLLETCGAGKPWLDHLLNLSLVLLVYRKHWPQWLNDISGYIDRNVLSILFSL